MFYGKLLFLFYIYIYIYINLKSSNIPEMVHRYWPIPIYVVLLTTLIQPPIRDWLICLEDLLASYSPSLTQCTTLSIIIGVSSRSFYNIFLTLYVYATICHYEVMKACPLDIYPGTKYSWEHFCDVSTRVC